MDAQSGIFLPVTQQWVVSSKLFSSSHGCVQSALSPALGATTRNSIVQVACRCWRRQSCDPCFAHPLSVAVFSECLLLVAETEEKLSRFTTVERTSQNIVNWYKSSQCWLQEGTGLFFSSSFSALQLFIVLFFLSGQITLCA